MRHWVRAQTLRTEFNGADYCEMNLETALTFENGFGFDVCKATGKFCRHSMLPANLSTSYDGIRANTQPVTVVGVDDF